MTAALTCNFSVRVGPHHHRADRPLLHASAHHDRRADPQLLRARRAGMTTALTRHCCVRVGPS